MNPMKHSEINWPLLIDFLKKQLGKPYIFGVENKQNEDNWDNYKAWDCSEIVEIGFHKIGIEVPDGSYNQAKVCKRLSRGEQLLIGDLGFKWNPDTEVIHHVGIYIGDGSVVEAKGKDWGVVITEKSQYESSKHFAYYGRLKIVEDA